MFPSANVSESFSRKIQIILLRNEVEHHKPNIMSRIGVLSTRVAKTCY